MRVLPLLLLLPFPAGACESGGGDPNGGTPSPEPDVVAEVEPNPEGIVDGGCPGGRFTSAVAGKVVDQAGEPLLGAKVQTCIRTPTGQYACLSPVDSQVDGSYTIGIGPPYDCMEELAMRVLVPAKTYATHYCDIHLTAGEPTLTFDGPIVLHETKPPKDLPPLGDPSVRRTVVFEDGLEMDVLPDDAYLDEESYPKLGATFVPAGTSDLCMPAELDAAPGAWALYPDTDVYNSPYPARIQDKLGLDDGTEVTIYMLGGLLYQDRKSVV